MHTFLNAMKSCECVANDTVIYIHICICPSSFNDMYAFKRFMQEGIKKRTLVYIFIVGVLLLGAIIITRYLTLVESLEKSLKLGVLRSGW